MVKYKTFDSLMASVENDLSVYSNDGYFNRGNFIKEARRVNSDLGLRLHKEKEKVIEVKDYKATLPHDFLFLQLAVACEVHYVTVPKFSGIQTEDHFEFFKVNEECGDVCEIAGQKGRVWVTQKVGLKTFKFDNIKPLSLTKNSQRFCSDHCLNHFFETPDQMNIVDEEEATFSFRSGKIYINYLSDLVDDDNNLMILDHPLVNDYYEYAIKKKFFENMKFNKEGDFLQDYQIAKQELKEARTRAILFINTQEYGEILSIHNENRKRFYKKYIQYFDNPDQGTYKFR